MIAFGEVEILRQLASDQAHLVVEDLSEESILYVK